MLEKYPKSESQLVDLELNASHLLFKANVGVMFTSLVQISKRIVIKTKIKHERSQNVQMAQHKYVNLQYVNPEFNPV